MILLIPVAIRLAGQLTAQVFKYRYTVNNCIRDCDDVRKLLLLTINTSKYSSGYFCVCLDFAYSIPVFHIGFAYTGGNLGYVDS